MLVNKRIIISIVILIGTTVLMVGAVAIPTIYSINGLEQKIAGEHAKIEARYTTRKAVRDALANLELSKKEISGLRQVAVLEGSELDFINALESIMDASGVDAHFTLEMANQKILSFWEREVPIRISAAGKSENVIRFLDGIRRSPYSITVNSVSMRRAGSDHGVSLDVNGSIYWLSKESPGFVLSGIAATADAVK